LEEEAYWKRYEYYTAGEILRKDDALAENARELAGKDRELAKKDRELDEAKRREEENIRKFVLNMHKEGFSIAAIAKVSEISESEVKEILDS